MSVEENKALIQRIFEEFLNGRKTEGLDELIASDYVYHGPGGHEVKGIEGLKKFLPGSIQAFPISISPLTILSAKGIKWLPFLQ